MILGLALFIGQAFLYNAVTFDLGTMLSRFFGVSSSSVPAFMVIFAAGNFLGPLLLGRLFDTVGRKPMISATYLSSAALTVLLAVLLMTGGLTRWSFIALVGITFFFASAGASAAYLTVSEIFPMETRALAIAFFFAVGTAAGGVAGPLLFGNLIEHGPGPAAIGFLVGAVVMALGGIAELLLGVRAERMPLENVAKPLTVADAEDQDAAMRGGAILAAEERGEGDRERDDRIARRQARIEQRESRGLRRYRPGPGTTLYSPGMVGTASGGAPTTEQDLDREIELISRVLAERGPTDRDDLAAAIGAHYWGPARFRAALREAVAEGRVRRVSRKTYGPVEQGAP
jgi:MFS family permease